MSKHTPKIRSTRRTFFKLGALVFSIVLLPVILVLVTRTERADAYLHDWSEMTSRTHTVADDEPDVYFVFTSIETHRFAQAIRPYVDEYLDENQPVPLYLINAQAIRGERHPKVNPGVPAQLIIIKDGEVDAVIDSIHAIAAVLNAPKEAINKTFHPGHLLHWADLPNQTEESEPQVIYIYNVGSTSHRDIAHRIDGFNFENPMDMTLYKVDNNATYGIPKPIINDTLFGLPLIFRNPTIAIRVNNEIVMLFKQLAEIIPFLDSVEDGTFQVIMPDPDDDPDDEPDETDNGEADNGETDNDDNGGDNDE